MRAFTCQCERGSTCTKQGPAQRRRPGTTLTRASRKMFVTRRSHGVTCVIAHRGASRAAPENTVAAFRRAAEMGADMVELDVRRSADGRLVVHHDAAPGRRPGDRRDASRRPAGRTCPTSTPRWTPAPGMAVNIEIKNDPDEPDFDPTDALADDVGRRRRRLEASTDRVARVVVRPRHASTAAGGRVAADRHRLAGRRRRPTDAVDVVVGRRPPALHPWWLTVDRRLVERCHAAGLRRQHLDLRRPGAHGASWPGGASTGSAPTSPTWRSPCCGAERQPAERRQRASRPAAASRERQQQVHHLGSVLEAQPAGLAEVVAVDLVRERAVRDSIDESSQVDVLVDACGSVSIAAAAQRAGQRGRGSAGPAALRNVIGHQPAVERRRRGEVERRGCRGTCTGWC